MFLFCFYCYLVSVGTVKEVPAVSCAEILMSVGDVSGRYWLVDHARSSLPFMAYCNMTTLGIKWLNFLEESKEIALPDYLCKRQLICPL